MPTAWKDACKAKKASQAESIPPAWRLKDLPPAEQNDIRDVYASCGILTAEELAITELDDVAHLLAQLRKGELSAVQVTTAYCKRAAIAHQLLNCNTEMFFSEAIDRAKELDEHLAKTAEVVGPLHGLPVSLKDQFDIAGIPSTMGYASWIGRISQEDSVPVHLLKQAGAILYTRTNVPQTMMWSATANHVFGQTCNAFNRSLTCSGSSGGEGALIGAKGSILGFGTDIGGSIRGPANAQGLYGLRPTMRRLPYGGVSNSLLGFESIESVIGPLSRSLSGLIAGMEALITGDPWRLDPKVVPIPWRPERLEVEKKLAIAVMYDDGNVQPHPPIKRALQKTIDALKAAGHEVLEWKAEQHKAMFDLTIDLYCTAGSADLQAVTKESGETAYPGLPLDFHAGEGVSVYQNWALNQQRDRHRLDTLRRWNATAAQTSTGRPIDAILSPVTAVAAHEHDFPVYIGYTCVWNLLDYPAAVFPVLPSLDAQLDPIDKAFKPYNDADAREQATYDPVKLKGPPICLQLIGARFEEERLLGLVGAVSAALGKDRQ